MLPDDWNRVTELAPLALTYHENSKIHPATSGPLAERIAEFTADEDELRRAATGAKTYPGSSRIDLRSLSAAPFGQERLSDVLDRRRTVRAFQKKPISLPLLATLLERACGVTGELRAAEPPDILQPVRAYPSGGALYPIEVYVAAFDVSGLSAGIHHYHAPHHCLEGVRPGDWRDQFARHIWLGGQPLSAPAVIILTARWERPLHKYGERGYRMLLLDAGHVSQNLLLTATALGLGGCPVGGFLDDPLAGTLGIDSREEPVLLCVLIGTPA